MGVEHIYASLVCDAPHVVALVNLNKYLSVDGFFIMPVGVVPEVHETVSVIAAEAVERGKPHQSVVCPPHSGYRIGWYSVARGIGVYQTVWLRTHTQGAHQHHYGEDKMSFHHYSYSLFR